MCDVFLFNLLEAASKVGILKMRDWLRNRTLIEYGCRCYVKVKVLELII